MKNIPKIHKAKSRLLRAEGIFCPAETAKSFIQPAVEEPKGTEVAEKVDRDVSAALFCKDWNKCKICAGLHGRKERNGADSSRHSKIQKSYCSLPGRYFRKIYFEARSITVMTETDKLHNKKWTAKEDKLNTPFAGTIGQKAA